MTKVLFSSKLTKEIEICDPIDPNDSDLDIEEDTWIIMQQCVDKYLEVIVLEPTPSDIRNIFKLKDLVKKKWDFVEFHCRTLLL